MEGDVVGGYPLSSERISIHSLRMEGDTRHKYSFLLKFYFNPLPPHGGRHDQNAYHVGDHVFQSTPSAWRET